MRPSLPLWFAAALALAPSLRGQQAAPARPPLTAAVLNFQTTGEALAGRGAETAVLLNAQLSAKAPDVVLVERQELEKVLGEQELGASGTVSPDGAAKIGALTGAKVLVTGRVMETGSKHLLVAKIISTETGRVYGETTSCPDLGALDRATEELAGKIAASLAAHADTLVAKVEDPSARLERWKKIVAGKVLPSVSVAVTEQHLGHPVIDPAVQTELRLVLQQLGFEVIDPKDSGKPAAVAITGEAFSELAGGRRGNLVSCRARVELKAVRLDGGKLLLADRQTDVAVDLAEHIAGKSALENAANRLLDRLLPRLIAAE